MFQPYDLLLSGNAPCLAMNGICPAEFAGGVRRRDSGFLNQKPRSRYEKRGLLANTSWGSPIKVKTNYSENLEKIN